MNIMSNGSFLDEMNASNEQSELVKKLASAWEQKNSKVARAGGVSLMALTLAACGGSDDTPFSQVDVDAAVTAANAAAAAEAAAAATAAAASEAAAVAAAEATAAEAATAAATAAAASEAAAVAAAEATAAEAATAAATAAAASEAAAVAAAEATATAAAEAAAAADIAAANAAKTTAEEAAATAATAQAAAATAQAAAETAQAAAETAQATAEAARDVALADKATAETAQAVAEAAKVAAEAAKVAAENATAIAETAKASAEASLATLQASYDSLLIDYDALANPVVNNFSLTTNVDSGADFTGNANANTYNAGLDAGANTLNALDSLDGGEGADTLNVSIATAVTPGAITNIETVNVTFSGAVALNATNMSGMETITNIGSTALGSVTNLSSTTPALVVSDNAAGATFAYKDASVTATDDSVSLTLSNVTGGTTTITGAVETVNLVSSSSANSVRLDSVATTLNISGDQNVTLAAASTVLDNAATISAADATGDVTLASDAGAGVAVTVTGGAGDDALTLAGSESATDTVTGGAGADNIIFAADLADADTVAGGDGEDTLSGVSAELVALTVANKITGIEAITVTDSHDGALTVATIGSDIDTVTLAAGAGASNGLTFGSGSATLNLGTDNTAALVVSDTGAGVTDTLTINALKADDSFGAQNVTINGFETVNINVTAVDADNTVGVFTIVGDPDADGVQTAATVNISGAGDFVFDTSDEFNIGASTGAGVIDASGLTGVFTMTDAAVGARTIIGGSGNDTIVSDNQENTLTGGAGNDDITGGTSADTINGGAGADTINGSTAAVGKYDTVSGGAGIDTFVYTDAQFDAAVTISGDDGVDIVSFADANAVLDAQYTLKSSIETVTSAAAGLTTTLDANAMAAGIETVKFAGTHDDGKADALTVTAGFTSALTVDLDALETAGGTNEDNNSVDAAAYTGVLTVNETSGVTDFGVEDASGDLVITGGTGTSDTFNFKGATIQASAIDQITAIENFVVSDDTSTDITLANANTADGKSLTVDGRAITTTSNTFAVDASAEADGAITVHGSSGVDTLTGSQSDMGDTLNGYAGADNFVFAAANLTTLDTVDGGVGTDTVKIATGTTIDADFTNVSNVEALTFTGATTATLGTAYSASGSVAVTITTGTNSLTMDAVTTAQSVTSSTGGDTIDASDMTAALTMNVTEDGLQANADTITAGTGTSDVLSITFDGADIATDAVTATNLANVTGFETLKSASNVIVGLTTDDANVASSKSLTIDMTANTSTLATVSIENETNGAITYLGGAGGNTVTMSVSSMGDTIIGATGDESITAAIGQLTSADTINGVSGTDTLTFSDVGVLADADLANVSNMDSMTLADGTNTIVLGAEYQEAGFTTIATAGSGADTITFGAGITSAQTVSIVATTGNDTINATAASGAITIVLDEDALTSGDTLTGGTGSDILDITFNGTDLAAADMAGVTKIEKITSSGDNAAGLTLHDNNNVSSVMTIDMSENTAAAATVSAVNENDGTIVYVGGAGVDTVTGSDTTTSGDTIGLGAGADVYNSTLGADTITGGTGADVFTYSAVADSTGTAKDSITDFTSGTDFISVVINNSTNTTGQTYDATVQTAAAGTSAVQAGMSGSIGQTFFDTTNNVMIVNANADNLVTTLDYQIGLNAAATAANTVAAGDVRYVITGGSGSDTIVTGGGADTITAGGGADVITAGDGQDHITLSTGGERVVVGSTTASTDIVEGFTSTADTIDITTSLLNVADATITDAGDISGSATVDAAIAVSATGTQYIFSHADFDLDLTAVTDGAGTAAELASITTAAIAALDGTDATNLDATFLATETVLFVLDDTSDTSAAIFAFNNADAASDDNTITAGELTLLAVVDANAILADGDILI